MGYFGDTTVTRKQKRKNKNIQISLEAWEYLKRHNKSFVPYNPTIVDDKLFITTAEEVKEEDDD